MSAHYAQAARSKASPAPAAVISFLDDDHVMKLTRLLLSRADASERLWLRDFFAPEPADLPALFALGRGLREDDGARVALADPDSREPLPASAVLAFRRGAVGAGTIERCPGLRLVQRLGAGAERIDLEAAWARGVEVSCLPRPTLAFTAEHVMLLMLALAKRLVVADRLVRTGERLTTLPAAAGGVAYNWPGLQDLGGLFQRTLGVVGLGEVGKLVARRAQAFGMRVLYTSRTRLPERAEAELAVEYRPLADLLHESQFVSLHIPPNGNEGAIGAAEIARMRSGSFLINASRGAILDEDALYRALVDGQLAGAALDVHAWEPRPAGDRFCALENVVLTPHLGGGSRHGVVAEVAAMYDNMRAALAGHRPPHGWVAPR